MHEQKNSPWDYKTTRKIQYTLKNAIFATYNEGLTFGTPEFENAVRNKLLNNRLIQNYITNPARLG